jgi:hypothetical protein
LKDEFTETEWNKIGQQLISDTLFVITQKEVDDYTNTNQLFDQYRSFIFQIIDGLNAAKLLESQNSSLYATNSQLEVFKNILTHKDLLEKYIEDNYNNYNVGLISVEHTITQGLQIQEHYKIYIERYGVPVKGIFDSELLLNIYNEINK